MKNSSANEALLVQMERQAELDKEVARKRRAAMSDAEKDAWQKRAKHVSQKMQSGV